MDEDERMDDKLIRQMVIIVLGIIGILAAITLIQTLIQMIIPISVIAIGGFAFYKIVLEGRDSPETMEDEVAETSGMVIKGTAEPVAEKEEEIPIKVIDQVEEAEQQAQERLSAVEKAQRDYVDTTTPAEEILDQIKSRKQRLEGDNQ